MDLLIFIIWGIFGAFVPILLARRHPKVLRLVRFLALYITLYLGIASAILGMSTQDMNILLVGLFGSLWGGLQMLLLPKTSPKTAKKYGLE